MLEYLLEIYKSYLYRKLYCYNDINEVTIFVGSPKSSLILYESEVQQINSDITLLYQSTILLKYR